MCVCGALGKPVGPSPPPRTPRADEQESKCGTRTNTHTHTHTHKQTHKHKHKHKHTHNAHHPHTSIQPWKPPRFNRQSQAAIMSRVEYHPLPSHTWSIYSCDTQRTTNCARHRRRPTSTPAPPAPPPAPLHHHDRRRPPPFPPPAPPITTTAAATAAAVDAAAAQVPYHQPTHRQAQPCPSAAQRSGSSAAWRDREIAQRCGLCACS
jgi:hypothetical protein